MKKFPLGNEGHRKSRAILTFLANVKHEVAYKWSLQILKVFLTNVSKSFQAKFCVLNTFKAILGIQKRMKRQMKVRFGKVEVLLNYWDKMIGKI